MKSVRGLTRADQMNQIESVLSAMTVHNPVQLGLGLVLHMVEWTIGYGTAESCILSFSQLKLRMLNVRILLGVAFSTRIGPLANEVFSYKMGTLVLLLITDK